MFRSFIYLDEEKMYSYLRQIDEKFVNKATNYTTKRNFGGAMGLPIVSINAGTEVEEHKVINTDTFNDYDKFEKDLCALEESEFFDFVLNSEYDLKTTPRMSIIRLNGRMIVPEQFDIFSLAQTFMPFISSQIATENKNEQELLASFFSNASADVPVLIDAEDILVSGKLSIQHLKELYSELEEYSEQDVFVLCKVIGVMNKVQVEIFNPLKDFIRLPRTIRRGIDISQNDGLESIYVDGPVLKVDIIAVYK